MTVITLWNLPVDTSEDRVSTALAPYAPVVSVRIERQGAADNPMAIVEVDLDPIAAGRLVLRLDGLWHEGRFLRAHLLMHP
jgi:hypothetical protein